MVILAPVPDWAYKQLKLKEKVEPEFATKTIIEDSQGNVKLPSKLLNEISLISGSHPTTIKVRSKRPLVLECIIGATKNE